MLSIVAQAINQLEWDKKTPLKLVVAVSGGVDSMVLLDSLQQLKETDDFATIELIIAHFNHQLRDTSQRDASHVISYCQAHGLVYIVDKWRHKDTNIGEAQARRARYQFLAKVYHQFKADALLTGHHLDDQIETLLMRFIRGTSLRGLNAIQARNTMSVALLDGPEVTIQVLRPMLSVSKVQINEYAANQDIKFVEDETNVSERYLRNKVRHKMLPLLMSENDQSYQHAKDAISIIQTSYQAHLDNFYYLEPHLALPNKEGGWTLKLKKWWSLSSNLRQIYLQIIMDERVVEKSGPYSLQVINRLLDLMAENKLPNRQFPITDNWIAKREYDKLKILPQSNLKNKAQETVIKLTHFNHWYSLSDIERIGIFDTLPSLSDNADYDHFVWSPSSKEAITELEVRHRRDGDVMVLSDADGKSFHKKISRILIDEKVPQQERDASWLVCQKNQKCLWLIGYRKASSHPTQGNNFKTYRILYEKNRENLYDL